jgi:hypothetical protein
LAAFYQTSLRALRAYLAGWQAYRAGRLGVNSEATEQFERALFLDSTFALAGLRLVEIGTRYGMRERDERWKLDAIWRRRDHLGPTDRALLDAYLGPRYPGAVTLADLMGAAERATRVASRRSEAWHTAGLCLFLFGPRIGYPGWENRASDAFGRALALDSSDVLSLRYLVLLAAVAGDSAAVRRYARVHQAHGVIGGHESELTQWVAAVVLGDSAGLARLRSQFVATGAALQGIVEWSEGLGLGLEDGDRAAQTYMEGSKSVGGRRSVIVRIVPYLLNRGRPEAADHLLATAERGFGEHLDVGVLEFRVYAALFWDADSAIAAAAVRSIEAFMAGARTPIGHVRDRETALCALAHWRIAARALAGADSALRELRSISAPPASYLIESTATCAAAAEAGLAATRRAPDAGAALSRLDSLLAAGSNVRQLLPTISTVVAARLHEARGDLRYALALSRRRTYWWNWLLSTPLREEGRLAVLVGDTAGAVRAYRHYLALRSDPEPRLRLEVERVRAELRRLEQLTPGR